MEYNENSMGFEVTETKVVYVVEADIDPDGWYGFDEDQLEELQADDFTPYWVCWIRRELTNKYFQIIGGPKLFQGQSFEDTVLESRGSVFEDLDLGSVDTLTDPVTGEDIDVYDFDYSRLPKILGCSLVNKS